MLVHAASKTSCSMMRTSSRYCRAKSCLGRHAADPLRRSEEWLLTPIRPNSGVSIDDFVRSSQSICWAAGAEQTAGMSSNLRGGKRAPSLFGRDAPSTASNKLGFQETGFVRVGSNASIFAMGQSSLLLP